MANRPASPGEQTPAVGLTPALEPYASYLLWQATMRTQERIRDALGPLGLRIPHHSVLRVLAEGARSQAALADALHTDRMMMVRVIDDLEQAGLVRRERNPRDRRAHDVTLTTQGEAMLDRTHGHINAVDAALLAPLSEGEREHFRAMLARIIEAYDAERASMDRAGDHAHPSQGAERGRLRPH